MPVSRSQIEAYCKRELLCDSVRFTSPGRKIFLVVGYKRHTRNDPGQWERDGVPYDFAYLEEHCYASGDSLREVLESIMFYNALLGMEDDDAWRLLFTVDDPQGRIVHA